MTFAPPPGRPLKHCNNPACNHWTSSGAAFCCGGCAQAADGKYDPDGYHSQDCMQRHVERGPTPPQW